MTIPPHSNSLRVQEIVESIFARQRFVISSHARPDGDSIGSQLAMAYALKTLGKEVRIVNKDAASAPLMAFPGVPSIEITDHVDGTFDAAIIMECGDLRRTESLRSRPLFRHQYRSPSRNANYGQLNWFDLDGRRLRRDGLRAHRRAWRTVVHRNRHAHLSGDPDRHRIVPLLEHFAAHLRHLP